MRYSIHALHRFATRTVSLFAVVVAIVVLSGCASAGKRPVFYPNYHLESVGRAQAERDIDACMALAARYGVDRTQDGELAQKATKGGVLGGVSAGVWGLVRGGNAAERAAAGAAAGAATGATVGAFDSAELSPTFKRFVQRCLGERGYDVIGWE